MSSPVVRTRFAPSPTGFMHVGNLRTALYEYLIAKSMHGRFILRIEDTDQERQVAGATEIIYNTLKTVGLQHDEGPDIGGPFEPYVQSKRKYIYIERAKQLVAEKKAYYCFCSEKRLSDLKETGQTFTGYDRHCRHLSDEEINENLKNNMPYVIRQKMPTTGTTTFHDAVYGDITVPNAELEDQILIKSDGFPTYNFANVIDDHDMDITHVVRGSEYLSSTPKYNKLYEAFGYTIPTYVHLPLILGSDGQKLSKRHGATGFLDLVKDGYLPEAIINYIALLGWAPSGSTEEIFSLKKLEEIFSVDGISKSPSIFDYDKLRWINGEYIKMMNTTNFLTYAMPFVLSTYETSKLVCPLDNLQQHVLASILQPRITQFTQIPTLISFLVHYPSTFDLSLFEHKKMKSTKELSLMMLSKIAPILKEETDWTKDNLHDLLLGMAKQFEVKNGQLLWPIRTAVSGLPITSGGAIELIYLLGKDESLNRIHQSITRLTEVLNNQKDK